MANNLYTDSSSGYTWVPSTDIKVFPCAYRGSVVSDSTTWAFDPESRLNTEYNLRRISGNVIEDNSYIVDWIGYDTISDASEAESTDLSNCLLKCVVGGYSFEVSGITVVTSPTYAAIKLAEVTIASDSTTETTYSANTYILNSWQSDEASTLDSQINSENTTYYFTGLVLTDTVPEDADYVLRLKTENEDICYSSFLPEIKHGSGAGSIVVNATKDNNNDASGINSFAGGSSANATGNHSFAFGEDVTASGPHSLAFGNNTITMSTAGNAIAMGNAVTVSGYDAIAIGDDIITYEIAEGAVAIGGDITAIGKNSIGIGKTVSAQSAGTVAIGTNVITNMLANGSVVIGKSLYSPSASEVVIGVSDSAFGAGAIAIGNNSKARFTNAIALGASATAMSTSGIAIGTSVTASGPSDIAIGTGLTVSSADGGATAIGRGHTVLAEGATALGLGNVISEAALYGFAAGAANEITGFEGIALGDGNSVTGSYAFAAGSFNQAAGEGAVAMGLSITAAGSYAAAIGYRNTVTSSASYGFAAGSNNYVDATYAAAIGYSHIIDETGSYGFTAGEANTISGPSGAALGFRNKIDVNGVCAFATGSVNRTNNAYTAVLGHGLIAAAEAQTVVGKYNASDTSALFIVGNGTGTSDRSNALAVYSESISLNTSAITGGDSLAISFDSLTISTDLLSVNSILSVTNSSVSISASVYLLGRGYIYSDVSIGNGNKITFLNSASSGDTALLLSGNYVITNSDGTLKAISTSGMILDSDTTLICLNRDNSSATAADPTTAMLSVAGGIYAADTSYLSGGFFMNTGNRIRLVSSTGYVHNFSFPSLSTTGGSATLATTSTAVQINIHTLSFTGTSASLTIEFPIAETSSSPIYLTSEYLGATYSDTLRNIYTYRSKIVGCPVVTLTTTSGSTTTKAAYQAQMTLLSATTSNVNNVIIHFTYFSGSSSTNIYTLSTTDTTFSYVFEESPF